MKPSLAVLNLFLVTIPTTSAARINLRVSRGRVLVPKQQESDCPIAFPTPRSSPPDAEPPYPIQMTITSVNRRSVGDGGEDQDGQDSGETSDSESDSDSDTEDEDGQTKSNSTSTSILQLHPQFIRPPWQFISIGLSPRQSSSSSSGSSDSPSGSSSSSNNTTPPVEIGFTLPSSSDPTTGESTSDTDTTSGSGSNSGSSSSTTGPCTLFLDLTSPDAKVSGAATVNVYALDGDAPGALVGTARFEAGAKATVNSFECAEPGVEMCFRLEVADESTEGGGSGSGGGSATSSAGAAGASSSATAGGGGTGAGAGEGEEEKDVEGGYEGDGEDGGAKKRQDGGNVVSYLQGGVVGMGLGMRYGC